MARVLRLAIVVCLFVPPAARAQEAVAGVASTGAGEVEDPALAEAAQRFDRGVEYYFAGNYGAALAEFLRAYELTGNAVVLYNLGQVSQALGRDADAAHYFERCIAEASCAESAEGRRAEVEGALAALRQELARLRVDVDVEGAEILVDDAVVGAAPLVDPLYLSPGPHTVLARHPDHGSVRRELMLASNVEERLVLTLVSPEAPPGPGPGETPPGEDGGSIASEWWFWTIIGVAVAGGAVTAGVLLAPAGTTYTDGDVPTYVLP